MKIFTKEYLLEELDLPYAAVSEHITDQSRWSTHLKIVFKDKDGTFYETFYSKGSTESQDEGPWEYEDEVTCYEVELKEVMIQTWVRVEKQGES